MNRVEIQLVVPLPSHLTVQRAYLSPVVTNACNELTVTPSVVRMWAAGRESWVGGSGASGPDKEAAAITLDRQSPGPRRP